MRKVALIIFLAFSVLLFGALNLCATQRGFRIPADTGKSLDIYKDYHALIVGVSDYDRWPDLPNAVKDARQVSKALEKLGFKVNLIENPTSKELTEALNSLTYGFGQEVNRAIFFFFAGHGETEILADGTKLGYVIPKDCPLLKKDPGGFIN